MAQDIFAQVLGQVTNRTVTGTAGGGAVSVTVDGLERAASVTIAPEAAEDVLMLQDLVAAAITSALEEAQSAGRESAMELLERLGRGARGRP